MTEPDPAGAADREAAANSRDRTSLDVGAVRLDAVDGTAVPRVTGALDLALTPKMRQLIDRAERLRPRALVVDLSEVSFLASMAMSELLRAQRAGSVPLRLVAASRIVLRPLTLTRLIDEFEVYPTLDEAVQGR